MRKILFALLAVLAVSASAETMVKIVWPFSPAGADSAMLRQIIDNANTAQTKYKFVYDNKPGAGGSIAVNSVISDRAVTVLAISSSFYVRPNLFKESHDVNQLSMIGEFCSKMPLAVFSKKYSRVTDVSNRDLSLGLVSGSITQLVSKGIQNNSNVKINEIAYKGTPEASGDMLGGHLDASVDFLGPMTLGRMTPDVKIIGITGDRNITGFVTFKSQNVQGLESITSTDYFFVPSTVDDAVKQELSSILATANQDNVKKICSDNYGVTEKFSYDSAKKLHQDNIVRWATITKGIERQ